MKRCLYCFEKLLTRPAINEVFKRPTQTSFCNTCYQRIAYITAKETACRRCQEKLTTAGICQKCLFWEQAFQVTMTQQALYYYNDFAVDFLWRIKKKRDVALMRGVYPDVKRFFRSHYNLAKTLFLPLPTDEISLQTRRFNLPALLLHELNIGLHTANVFPLLTEKKVKQNSLMRNERMRNASQMYAISDEGATIIQQKRWQEIVLIDDVYTTGSTMMRGIAAVKKKTDTKISSFTLFR